MLKAKKWKQLLIPLMVICVGCGMGGSADVRLGATEQGAGGAPCDWGANIPQPEGWNFTIPIQVDPGPAGVDVDCVTSVLIGVENDGQGSPPAAPPEGSVDSSSISIWDVGDGTTITSGAAIPARVTPSTPFANGCYKFLLNVAALRTYNLLTGHIYQIECRAEYMVTRYKAGPVVDRVSELAFGFGSITVTIEY
jgi:hypothetical protein